MTSVTASLALSLRGTFRRPPSRQQKRVHDELKRSLEKPQRHRERAEFRRKGEYDDLSA
jgi:hypothetical protein